MAKKHLSDEERFWQHVVLDPYTSCLVWQLDKDKDGYGQFKAGSRTDGSRRQYRAHKWAYEKYVGPVPVGLQLDHLCRNRPCVNWLHLEPVTGLVNTRRGIRATKLYCDSGHPLFGENLKISKAGRVCRECSRRLTHQNYRWTNGEAQKKFAANNKEKRAEAQRIRRANWTDEQKAYYRDYSRWYEATKRVRSSAGE